MSNNVKYTRLKLNLSARGKTDGGSARLRLDGVLYLLLLFGSIAQMAERLACN